MADEIKSHLNERQWKAVRTTEGPLLVIAGPGSGKTRVIEYRVLHLIEEGVAPKQILLLTFTRKAAQEMLSRAAMHDERASHVHGGTFHSFAYKLVNEFKERLGFFGSLSVLDEGDVEEALQNLVGRLGLAEGDIAFPKKHTLRAILSGAINKDKTIPEILEHSYEHLLPHAKTIERLEEAYAAYKREAGYLDFDDLLRYAVELLRNPDVARVVGSRYRYVMVDEYQDTNRLQGEIAYLLARAHANIMVVGDDAQSIYGFRGAYHENIMQFPKLFPDCVTILLEENYRSTQTILDLGNAILETMPKKFKKTLIAARGEAGIKPQMGYFGDAEEEAHWARSRVQFLEKKGVPLGEQAVLFRSSYISIPLQAELTKHGISYEVYGGLKFYEMAHVKDMLAYLKILANDKDELSWNRVLLLIPGVGPKTADAIWNDIQHRNGDTPGKWKKYPDGVRVLFETFKLATEGSKPFQDRFDILLAHYIPVLKQKFDDWPSRKNDLEVLREIAAYYDELQSFLADCAIEPPERRQKRKEGALTLSTIHSAKGLEWDSVCLLGAIDGTLPSKMAFDSEEEIEEEQRLLYVAVTRAKNNLALLFHLESGRGGFSFHRLSRFLEEEEVFAALEHKDYSERRARERAVWNEGTDGIDEDDEEIEYE